MKLSSYINVHRDDIQYSDKGVTIKLHSLSLKKVLQLVDYQLARLKVDNKESCIVNMREANYKEEKAFLLPVGRNEILYLVEIEVQP